MRKKEQTTKLEPSCLQWARERANLIIKTLADKMHVNEEDVSAWEATGEISLHNAERLANVTRTPLGYLFLSEPPVEKLPIDDFRTVNGRSIERPSADLLDVIYDALRRQEWYREYIIAGGGNPLGFVGSMQMSRDVRRAAEDIRAIVSWDSNLRSKIPSWDAALKKQIEAVEDAGILIMRSGIVGNNTHRSLSVTEFRGFALADKYAPIVFINGKDAKSAQIFTLAHELVHIWLGVSGVSNLTQTYSSSIATEQFCNKVAAELLVPHAELAAQWNAAQAFPKPIDYLRRYFKVSSLVLLRRLCDMGYISNKEFNRLYNDELAQCIRPQGESGGNAYANIRSRTGERLATALVESAFEGRTSYRDAFQLLGIAKMDTFRELAKQIGVIA